jgi:hypothetical protein
VYAQDEQTYPSVPPTEVRPSSGEPIDVSTRSFDLPDTDGDGVADVKLEGVDNAMAFTLRRGDGELVLAVDDDTVSVSGGQWIGDLDGDGRDEVVVIVADGTEAPWTLHVVAGSTPAGRHDPRAIGTRFESNDGTVNGVVSAIGDVDRDGKDDLLLRASGEAPTVIAGPAVMAAAGGALPADTPALAVLPEDVREMLLLADDRPVPVRVGTAGDGSGATELTLMTEPPIVLRTDRVGAFEVRSPGLITGFESDEHRYVLLQSPTTRSGTQTTFIWDLDDPCAGPTPAN